MSNTVFEIRISYLKRTCKISYLSFLLICFSSISPFTICFWNFNVLQSCSLVPLTFSKITDNSTKIIKCIGYLIISLIKMILRQFTHFLRAQVLHQKWRKVILILRVKIAILLLPKWSLINFDHVVNYAFNTHFVQN